MDVHKATSYTLKRVKLIDNCGAVVSWINCYLIEISLIIKRSFKSITYIFGIYTQYTNVG